MTRDELIALVVIVLLAVLGGVGMIAVSGPYQATACDEGLNILNHRADSLNELKSLYFANYGHALWHDEPKRAERWARRIERLERSDSILQEDAKWLNVLCE